MIWDGKRPCDFQLWDGFRRSKDVVHWFGSFALGRGGMFWTNLCALYFLLWAASSKNCRLDGKMDPQRQTPRCKRTHPGFTGWNHSKMPLQTPGGTKKVSGSSEDWIGKTGKSYATGTDLASFSHRLEWQSTYLKWFGIEWCSVWVTGNMIWDGKRPCDFQLWDGFRRSKDGSLVWLICTGQGRHVLN